MAKNEKESEMVSQFMGVTGADEERTRFYLESSAWQLQAALSSFFDEDDSPMETVTAPSGPTVPEPPEEDTTPSMEVGPSSGAGPTLGQGAKPPKQSSRFATIGDLRGEDTGDNEEEGQRFYTGGADHGSGQQVVGPRKKKNSDNIVKDLFKSAREHGAEDISSQESPGTSGQESFVFRGAAYRLGESPSDSMQPVPGSVGTMPTKAKQKHVVLKLWKNGFSVDDGPLRDFKSPENNDFLKSISKGEIPMELIQGAQGGEVNLDLEDHRDDDYKQAQPQRKAFGGKGYKLGNVTPSLAGESSQAATPPAAATIAPTGSTIAPTGSTWEVDTTQPMTTIQLRLGNGSRLTGKFNHTHTVADIRRFIALSRPEYATASYKLLTTFPNKVLDNDSQTISEANLLNAVIVQRLT